MKKKFNPVGIEKKKIILLALLGIVTCFFLASMIMGRLDMFFAIIPTLVFWGAPILSIIYWIRHKKWSYLISFLLLLLLVALFSALVYYTNSSHNFKIVLSLKKVRATIFIALLCLIVGQGCLMLFWKPAKKFGLWLFFIMLATFCAVTGRVIDFATEKDGQRHYSDYGFVTSGYDQTEAYYNNQEK